MPSGLPDLPFHDAEVLVVRLDRDGPRVELDIEVSAQFPDARVVRLRFDGVTEFQLQDIDSQNVLFDLRAEQQDDGRWAVELEASTGMRGGLQCAAIEHSHVTRPSLDPARGAEVARKLQVT